VLNEKENGGLGIGSLKAFNLAFLQNGGGDINLKMALFGRMLFKQFTVSAVDWKAQILKGRHPVFGGTSCRSIKLSER